MEQRFLYIKRGRKKIRSKAFDFEAMCLIDDCRDKDGGVVKKCLDSLFYMFAGTDITDEELSKLPHEQLTLFCTKLFLWYRETLLSAIPKDNAAGTEKGNFKLRGIYRKLFSAFGILPGKLAQEDPRLLLYALTNDENKKSSADDIPAEVKMLYGL